MNEEHAKMPPDGDQPELPETPEPVADASATSPKVKARRKAEKILPTDRIAFPKQLEILRAYGQLGSTGRAVTNGDVAKVVGLHANTASLANTFFTDVGLLQRSADGQVPAPEVIAFARAHEFGDQKAATKLGPALTNAWFAHAIVPKVRFRAHATQEAIIALAEAAGASTDHRSQLQALLDLLEAAGLVQVDGDQIRGAKPSDGRGATAEIGEVAAASAATPRAPEGTMTHTFPLRRGVTISINLPADLTTKDVGRISKWLETLPMDQEGET